MISSFQVQGWEPIWVDLDNLPEYWRTPEWAVVTWAEHLWEADGRPFTFVYLRDAPGDKYLPHHYCDEAELRALLAGFAVDDLRLVRVEYADEDGVIQVGAHYHVQARRL